MNKTKIISVANHKGGVGKTTTVASVGVGLARKGFKVLLVDLDAQANLTSSLLEEEPAMTLYDTLIEGHELSIVHVMDNVDIIPSSLDLSSAELELSSKMDREYILLELLEEVKRDYDYIIIDCPPSLGLLTINALVASTDLYIPMTAEVLPTRGMNTLIKSIEMVKKRANKELKLSGSSVISYLRRRFERISLWQKLLSLQLTSIPITPSVTVQRTMARWLKR